MTQYLPLTCPALRYRGESLRSRHVCQAMLRFTQKTKHVLSYRGVTSSPSCCRRRRILRIVIVCRAMAGFASPLPCGPFAVESSVRPEVPPAIPLVKSYQDYKDLKKIGAGAYGDVYSGRDPTTGDLVALKRMQITNDPSNKEGFPITALREIMLLFAVRDPNVVALRDVVRGTFLRTLRIRHCMIRKQ